MEHRRAQNSLRRSGMDIQHPDIERTERFGYQSKEYMDYEREEDSSEIEDD